MTDTTDRREQGTDSISPDGKEGGSTPSAPRVSVLGWTLTVLGIIAAVGIIWTLVPGDESEVASTPIEIAEAFMNALNAHDVDAMLALTASEEVLARNGDNGTIESFRSQMEQRQVLGWNRDFSCSERDELVVACTFAFTNHITDVFGLEPYGGSEMVLRIDDGVITMVTDLEDTDEWQNEGLGVFHQWLVDNYPTDEWPESWYYNYTDEANLDFWKQYMPLLLASAEAGRATEVEIAEAFMNALNAHDVDAMLELSASEEVLASTADDTTIEWFRSQMEQREVLGWTYDFTCHAQSETVVVCPAAFTNHITEVFDIEPYEGSEVILTIEDGLVTGFVLNEDTDAWQSEDGFGVFYQWMLANYPDEDHTENMYYNYGDEANLDFFKQYIPLLLASGG